MGVRIINEVHSDNGTITDSTVLTDYPISNLKNPLLANKWGSGAGTTSITIDIDMGVDAVNVTAFAFIDHSLISSDTIELQYADDSGFTTGTGTIAVTRTQDYIYKYFTSVTKRYWRVYITKSVTSSRTAGRLILGDHIELGYGVKEPNFTLSPGLTTSKTVRTEGGQLYSDIGVVVQTASGIIPAVTDDEKYILEDHINDISTAIPFVISFSWEVYPIKKTVYGTYKSLPKIKSANSPNLWEFGFNILEQK